jgi:predicted site-specific integrase-resolvase
MWPRALTIGPAGRGLDRGHAGGDPGGRSERRFAINFLQNKYVQKASRPTTDPTRKQAVIYARVSSKEGFSISEQLKLLKEYAAANGFAVAQEYVDVETAKQTGRAAFGEMVAYLKAHPSIRVMLVEKTEGA